MGSVPALIIDHHMSCQLRISASAEADYTTYRANDVEVPSTYLVE